MVHDGKPYDSKAIVGAAHGYLPGQQTLSSAEFSGGEDTVAQLLRRLGFTVSASHPARLTADELIRARFISDSEPRERAPRHLPAGDAAAVDERPRAAAIPGSPPGRRPSGRCVPCWNATAGPGASPAGLPGRRLCSTLACGNGVAAHDVSLVDWDALVLSLDRGFGDLAGDRRPRAVTSTCRQLDPLDGQRAERQGRQSAARSAHTSAQGGRLRLQ